MGRSLKEKISKSVEHIKKQGVGEFVSSKSFRLSQRWERFWGIFSASKRAPKRILGIWDYRYFAWAWGDAMWFVNVLNIQKIKHNAEAIDVCIIYDPEDPGHGVSIYSHITKETAQDYAFEYLPLFGMCHSLGNVYCFKSRMEFHRFLKLNAERYVQYPDNVATFEEGYFYGHCLYAIQDFYKENKYIPYLNLGGKYALWAQNFYKKNLLPGEVPVVISLRRQTWTPERNAHVPTWIAFMDQVKESFPEVRFIVVGGREEIVPELEARKDLLIAKKFYSTMMEDCALVRTAAMYMGLDCGINEQAKLSDQPYIVCQGDSHHLFNLLEEKGYSFSTDLQKYFSVKTPVTVEFLFKNFCEIYPKAKLRLKDPVWKKL